MTLVGDIVRRCRACGVPTEPDAEGPCAVCNSDRIDYWCHSHNLWTGGPECKQCSGAAVVTPAPSPRAVEVITTVRIDIPSARVPEPIAAPVKPADPPRPPPAPTRPVPPAPRRPDATITKPKPRPITGVDRFLWSFVLLSIPTLLAYGIWDTSGEFIVAPCCAAIVAIGVISAASKDSKNLFRATPAKAWGLFCWFLAMFTISINAWLITTGCALLIAAIRRGLFQRKR